MNIFKLIEHFLLKGFFEIGLSPNYYELVSVIIIMTILIIVSWIADFITKNTILTTISILSKKTETVWDDILVEKKVFHRAARLAPALTFFLASPYAFYKYPDMAHIIQVISKSMMVFIIARVIDAFLNASHTIYDLGPNAKQKPIKGYIQVVKIIVYFVCTILVLSIVFNKSLVYFFSGLGALAAVLLLVFKDTILGLVASVQLSSNNMIKIGDWITFNKYNADGNVVEISLHTVKVQNFDKTIVTIPTYALISEAFQNWRGMEESAGRRFKRLLLFDTRSVKFCDESLIKKLNAEPVLSYFLKIHGEEIALQFSKKDQLIQLTNMGIFRMYAEHILHNHSQINQDLSHFVKHGILNENGLSMEITSFSREKTSIPFEKLQSELVEHLLAIAITFELTIFQKPSGHDMRAL